MNTANRSIKNKERVTTNDPIENIESGIRGTIYDRAKKTAITEGIPKTNAAKYFILPKYKFLTVPIHAVTPTINKE